MTQEMEKENGNTVIGCNWLVFEAVSKHTVLTLFARLN